MIAYTIDEINLLLSNADNKADFKNISDYLIEYKKQYTLRDLFIWRCYINTVLNYY